MWYSCTPLKPAFVLSVLSNLLSSANCTSFSRLTSEHAAQHRFFAGFHQQSLSTERANCLSLFFSPMFAHIGDHSLSITWLPNFIEVLKGRTSRSFSKPQVVPISLSSLFSCSLAPSESSVTQYKGPLDPSTTSSPIHTLRHVCESASWPEQSVFRIVWQKQHWPLTSSHVLQLIIIKKGCGIGPSKSLSMMNGNSKH